MREANHSKGYWAGFLKVGHSWAKLGKFSTLPKNIRYEHAKIEDDFFFLKTLLKR